MNNFNGLYGKIYTCLSNRLEPTIIKNIYKCILNVSREN